MKPYLPFVIMMLMGGCASSPTPPPPEKPAAIRQNDVRQDKALAAQHWGAIASDVVARTKSALTDKDALQGRSLFVTSSSKSPFEQAFANFMVTRLVEAGLPVTTQQDESLEISYETQLIQHKTDFDPRKVGYVPGAPEGIGASYWVMRNVENPTGRSATMQEQSHGKAGMYPTSIELVVTTSVMDGENYLHRTTDVYYVEGADTELFRSKGQGSAFKEWGVVSQ